MRVQASRGFVAGRQPEYSFRYSDPPSLILFNYREGAMNIAIAKPKLGEDSKAFLAKKHQMLIAAGQARGRTRHDCR
jgi:hypothetical protein